MKLAEIYALIDRIAPFHLSREYCEKFDAYDNSGILLDCGREIKRILFSLDCSSVAVKEAERLSAELIVTHHPAIYAPLKSLDRDNPVTACARAGISVISAHLNLDCAKGGIDDCLAEALGAKKRLERMHTLSCGGYGSVFKTELMPLDAFVEKAKAEFQTERVLFYGARSVEKVASFCGAGFDEESIAFALENGADTIVSSDPKHHLIALALERGMNVVLLTHYAAENYGYFKFYQKIKEKCSPVTADYFADERFM